MRGQITIYVFVALLLNLVVLAALAPLINSANDMILAALDEDDAVSALGVRLILPVLIFSLILGTMAYADPLRRYG